MCVLPDSTSGASQRGFVTAALMAAEASMAEAPVILARLKSATCRDAHIAYAAEARVLAFKLEGSTLQGYLSQ